MCHVDREYILRKETVHEIATHGIHICPNNHLIYIITFTTQKYSSKLTSNSNRHRRHRLPNEGRSKYANRWYQLYIPVYAALEKVALLHQMYTLRPTSAP